MSRLRQAVILAAGMGTRLAGHGLEGRPKGMLEVGNETLIEQSLRRLQGSGIDRVTIVTGHGRSWYDSLAQASNGFVDTVHNPLYDRSGSMYSLFLARRAIRGDFLLLESDLVYEQRALAVLQQSDTPDCILLSGYSHSHDEVFVEAAGGNLLRMSKNRSELGGVSGEFVGINRVSESLYGQLLDHAVRRFERTLHVDYETECFVDVASERPVPCRVVADLVWAEIDDLDHLVRARNEVYPEILRRDGAVLQQPRAASAGRS